MNSTGKHIKRIFFEIPNDKDVEIYSTYDFGNVYRIIFSKAETKEVMPFGWPNNTENISEYIERTQKFHGRFSRNVEKNIFAHVSFLSKILQRISFQTMARKLEILYFMYTDTRKEMRKLNLAICSRQIDLKWEKRPLCIKW